MYEIDNEAQVIQSLTAYLQHFKTYFVNAISLVQCYLFAHKFGQNHQRNARNKIAQKQFSLVFAVSPFKLYINTHNISYLDRFFMRIIQFLEYRVNIFKSQNITSNNIPKFHVFVNNYSNLLRGLGEISQANRKQKSKSVGDVLLEIQLLVQRCFDSFFKTLQQTNNLDPVFLQELATSRQLVKDRIFVPMRRYLNGFMQSPQLSVGIWNEEKSFRKNEEIQVDWRSHYRSRSEFHIQSVGSAGSNELRNRLVYRQSKNNKPTQHTVDNFRIFAHIKSKETPTQESIPKSRRNSYAQMLAIMDIENVEVFSREYIMNDLKNKNVKNKMMISKFSKQYKRKQRKVQKNKQYTVSIEKNVEEINMQQQGKQVKFINDKEDKDEEKEKNENLRSESHIKRQSNLIVKSKQNILKHEKQKFDSILDQNSDKQQYFLENKNLTTYNINISNCNTVNQSRLQLIAGKDTFAYREQEKMYFYQLKSKMNKHFQKVSTPFHINKDLLQLQGFKRMDRSPENKFIVEEVKQKLSQRVISKRTTIKGSNFASFVNETRNRSCHSNSQLLNKSQLILNNIDTLSSLQGSSLQKLIPRMGKKRNLVEIEQGDNRKIGELIRMEKKAQSQHEIEPETALVILPRIVAMKRRNNKARMEK